MASELTPEAIGRMRATMAIDTEPFLIYRDSLVPLLDAAERCAAAEAHLSDIQGLFPFSSRPALLEVQDLQAKLAAAEAQAKAAGELLRAAKERAEKGHATDCPAGYNYEPWHRPCECGNYDLVDVIEAAERAGIGQHQD